MVVAGSNMTPHPGFLAPASLKERNAGQVSEPIAPHPGFLAPASLKAVLRQQLDPVALEPHPGFLAPASLKVRRQPHRGVQGERLIRGFLPRPH